MLVKVLELSFQLIALKSIVCIEVLNEVAAAQTQSVIASGTSPGVGLRAATTRSPNARMTSQLSSLEPSSTTTTSVRG